LKFPQRLKPRPKQSVYRSAEALRHPKAETKSSFSATSKAALEFVAVAAQLKAVPFQSKLTDCLH
jgi:hypothetical protein